MTGMREPSRESSPRLQVPSTASGGDDFQRGEQGEGDGQVEMAAFLGHVGGRQVDGDALGRKCDGHRRQRGSHAVARLGHGLVGQAHEREGRDAGGDGALHLDLAGLDALEGDGVGAGDHGGLRSVRMVNG